jgi:hypothetical protein
MRARRFIVALLAVAVSHTGFGYSLDLSAALGLQGSYFPYTALYPQQSSWNVSGSVEPKLRLAWPRDRMGFDATLFFRADKADKSRTHGDASELVFNKLWRDWELRVGARKVFWGVTESQHLVDIVNQLDMVEDPLGDAKLGQPMVNLTRIGTGWSLDFLVMPFFRERTFPGEGGRFRGPLPVDTSVAIYESGAGRWHPDAAARFALRRGIADLGLSYFYGTQRQPLLSPNSAGTKFEPTYPLLHQSGVDLQLTGAGFLGKFEGVFRGNRTYQSTNYALTAGGEYTFSDVFRSGYDFGVLAEYLHDSRGTEAPTLADDDIFVGVRLSLNDQYNSSFLCGAIIDRKGRDAIGLLKASRRLSEEWKLSLRGSFVHAPNPSNPIYNFRQDSYLQLELTYFLLP